MTLIDLLPPQQRRDLRRLRYRIAKRQYMRRVREERKLLCVGVDLPIDAGTCGRFVHAGYQRCIHCTRRRWWLLTRAFNLRRSPSPRCSKSTRLTTTLSTASRGGCSPAPSTLRRSPPPRCSNTARLTATLSTASRRPSRFLRTSPIPACAGEVPSKRRPAMFGHCRQPSGIAAGSPTCASITPAGNLTLATSSLRSSSSTTPAATTTAPITTAPTLYPHGHLLFVTHAAPASATRMRSRRRANVHQTHGRRHDLQPLSRRERPRRRPTTRRRLTTTSTKRPRCATAASTAGPPQPPCTDRPRGRSMQSRRARRSHTNGRLAVRFRPRCPNN